MIEIERLYRPMASNPDQEWAGGGAAGRRNIPVRVLIGLLGINGPTAK